MAKLPVPPRLPWKEQDIKAGDPVLLTEYLKGLLKILRSAISDIHNVVNLNSIDYVAQDAKPTPRTGQLLVWKDTDAGAGNPTHYLVYNDGTGVVTFASEETA